MVTHGISRHLVLFCCVASWGRCRGDAGGGFSVRPSRNRSCFFFSPIMKAVQTPGGIMALSSLMKFFKSCLLALKCDCVAEVARF